MIKAQGKIDIKTNKILFKAWIYMDMDIYGYIYILFLQNIIKFQRWNISHYLRTRGEEAEVAELFLSEGFSSLVFTFENHYHCIDYHNISFPRNQHKFHQYHHQYINDFCIRYLWKVWRHHKKTKWGRTRFCLGSFDQWKCSVTKMKTPWIDDQ